MLSYSIVSEGSNAQRVALSICEHASWEVDIIGVNGLLDMEIASRQLSIQLFDSDHHCNTEPVSSIDERA